MNDTKIVDRLQQRPAGGGSTKIEAGEQPRRKGDLPIVFPEFGEIGVVMGLGEYADALDRRIKRIPVNQLEDRGANGAVGRFGIEDDDCRVPQLQRCGVEITQRP